MDYSIFIDDRTDEERALADAYERGYSAGYRDGYDDGQDDAAVALNARDAEE